MLVHQQPEPVFPAEAGKERAFVGGCLPVQVELRSPPTSGAILEFCYAGQKGVSVLRGSRQAFSLNLKIARLLHSLIVGHEVRAVASMADRRNQQKAPKKNPSK